MTQSNSFELVAGDSFVSATKDQVFVSSEGGDPIAQVQEILLGMNLDREEVVEAEVSLTVPDAMEKMLAIDLVPESEQIDGVREAKRSNLTKTQRHVAALLSASNGRWVRTSEVHDWDEGDRGDRAIRYHLKNLAEAGIAEHKRSQSQGAPALYRLAPDFRDEFDESDLVGQDSINTAPTKRITN